MPTRAGNSIRGTSAFGARHLLRPRRRQFDLKETNDLIKLLLTMTRNKVAEKGRQRRQRRDSR
jgi:hypothetical protein